MPWLDLPKLTVLADLRLRGSELLVKVENRPRALTFADGTCGNCTAGGPISRAAKTSDMIVNLCANVDLDRTALPAWSLAGQLALHADIFSIGGLLQRLTIPSGSFPTSALPPYGASDAPVATNTAVVCRPPRLRS